MRSRWKGRAVFAVSMCVLTFGLHPWAAASDTTPAGVVLWNKLGTPWQVTHSQVGPGGQKSGGTFVDGRFGTAFRARYDQDYVLRFPGAVVNAPSGTIEFWARIAGFPETVPGTGGGQPVFVRVWNGTTESQRYKLFFTSNDGAGGNGLSAYAGSMDEFGSGAATAASMTSTYADVLGTRTTGWHHYALAWSLTGIQGVDDGTRQVAAFVDGKLVSTYWGPSTSTFPAFSRSFLSLAAVDQVEQGVVVMDNLMVWNCALTNFSGRGTGVPTLRNCAG